MAATETRSAEAVPAMPSYRKLDYSNPPTAEDDPEAFKLKNLNWLHIYILFTPSIVFLYGLTTTPITKEAFIVGVVTYFFCGWGITAGYHRLWSHRAYDAALPVRLFLAFWGAGALQGSARWWCRNHRSHHRYTDTNKDPYNVRKGFWWAHMGWMLVKQNTKRIGRCDIRDLNNDPLLKWQHKYYLPLALGAAVGVPLAVCSYLGDFWGGLYYAVMARIVFVHQSTFFVNSLAHYFGDQPFSDHHSARDSFVTALLTLGEGYHDEHHSYPRDYRNAIKFYQYDPTKWLIAGLYYLGLTWNLHRTADEEFDKARLSMQQRQLDREKFRLVYGNSTENLPAMTWQDVDKRVACGDQLMVVDDCVLDVAPFLDEHPGGRTLLLQQVGKDATSAYINNPHQHSPSARKFMTSLYVGRITAAHKAGKTK